MDLLYQSRRLLRDLFFNLVTVLFNIFIRRDRDIILFGGRFGDRFSGNARFLFQYCHNNKQKYGFKRVIWVTRSKKIRDELIRMGYECYLMHSLRSYYWHLKAGRHIIGGAFCPEKKNGIIYKPDILSVLSMGAECIYLGHWAFWVKGNPRDGESGLTGKGPRLFVVKLFGMLYNVGFVRKFILYPGGWDSCTVLARHPSQDPKDRFNRYVIAGLPEMCPCLKYTPKEKELLDRMRSDGRKIILYTPTHRTVYSPDYRPPLDSREFCDFLRKNKYVWVEKLHPSAPDYMLASEYPEDISILLDNSFDLNIIAEISSVMITDFSSTYQKAVWYYKPYLFYTPDLKHYLSRDFGLTKEFLEFVGDGFITDTSQLAGKITYAVSDDYVSERKADYDDLRNKYYDVNGTDYGVIAERLFGSV